MLETRDLYKIYKPKKGVAVTALNKVSLKFPEKGMVFLLGKSGSGKSTMLNLLGGLDKYDSGEIIIKGVSSKDFNQQHFDSYRNTYVGFIFQEYNILDEFSVGANIALALQLQGKKPTDEEINEILKEVDLDGYGNRKPNELSGGQKQRVAIARALVKNPEIIMADEPTGALDSNTGRQVFDTLKKLSKDKLVIIVSHDREFSELYADRIIELADGNVISDVEVDTQAEENRNESLDFQGATITVAPGYHLTEEDRLAINEYIERITDQNLNLKLTSAGDAAKKFVPTNQDNIKTQDGSKFALIKSKLPLKHAFKIGASGLKHKKFRLVMTILLSCVAFALFGLADTFGSYNHIDACTNSLVDSEVGHVSLAKAIRRGNSIETYYTTNGTSFTQEEIKTIQENTGIKMTGIFTPVNSDLGFYSYIDPETKFSENDNYNIYGLAFNGYAEINENSLKEFGYEILAGTLPDGSKDEIAISAYLYETFRLGKYTDGSSDTNGKIIYQTISKPGDLIGKKLKVNNTEYTITAVVDTHVDLERYKVLMEDYEHLSVTDQLVYFILMNEFNYNVDCSFAGSMMVGNGYVEKLIEKEPDIYPLNMKYVYYYGYDQKEELNVSIDPTYMCRLEDVKGQKINWVDGERTTLGEKEIIVTSDMFYEEIEDSSLLKNLNLEINSFGSGDDWFTDDGYRIVGIIKLDETNYQYGGTVVASESEFKKFITLEKGDYAYLVGAMPEEKEDIRQMVSYCYQEDAKIQYQIQNAVTYELDAINSVLKVLSKVFLYIGIGFAVFASLMLANFIGTSISYKKQEIGILRAIGSRSNDVFRIFFSESFIIAMINFVLATTGVGVATAVINSVIRKECGVLITVLDFGIRQVALLFVVSIVVAALASFLPVKKIASKRPIDAIRNR